MSFPRYSAYRPITSGWLKEVPNHWSKLWKIREISSLKGRLGWQGLKADEYLDQGPYVVSSAHFADHRIQWEQCPRVSDERYKLDENIQLSESDVLLMKDGAAMGKLAYVDRLPGPACLNSHLLLFRPVFRNEEPSYWPKFLFYFLQTGYFQDHIKVNGTGATFLGISQEAIGSYGVVWPPVSEQAVIAKFLDRETAKIDALVAEQQGLIELLKEKRRAVISHAVTKGLDPDAPMKPSGIEWLGDVPAHWEVMKCSNLGPLFGSEPVAEEGVVRDGTLPFIKVGSLGEADFNVESWDWFVEPALAAGLRTQTNFIVFPKRGAAIFTNKVNVVDRPSVIDPNLMGWKIGSKAVAQYLAYALKTRKLSELADISTIPQLNNKHIAPVRFPLPPLSEQREIVAYLDARASSFDQLAEAAQRAVELLQERRTALISAAVTGQIDVRELAKKQEAA